MTVGLLNINTLPICFTVSQNSDEHNYEYMSALLVESLKITNPTLNRVCMIAPGLPKGLVGYLEKNCEVISLNHTPSGHDDYYMRPLGIVKLWEHLGSDFLYTDIDVVFLKSLDYEVTRDSILAELMPDFIAKEEMVDTNTVFSWLTHVTNENIKVFDMEFKSQHVKDNWHWYFTKNVERIGIDVNQFTQGAIYPIRPLTNETQAFHYDNFINRGYYYKLKNHPLFSQIDRFRKLWFTDQYLPEYWETRYNVRQTI